MKSKGDPLERALLLAIAALGIALLALAFISMPVGAYAFFSNQINGTSATANLNELYLYVVGVQVLFPVPAGLATLGNTFFLMWAIYVAFMVLLVRGPWYSLVKALRSIASDGTLAVYSSGALVWSLAFPLTLLMAVFIDNLVTSAGVPIGSLPTVDARFVFWQTTYAPLVEEIGFRVTIVGVVALLMAMNAGGGWRSLWALWHPSRALGSIGVETWKQPGMYAAVLGSAAIFGIAHVLGGWQIGKFFSAFAVGLVFGFLYYTHGLPLAVIMHWGFDYFGYSLFYFDQIRGLPPLSNEFTSLASLQYTQFYSDLLTYMISIGVLVLVVYIVGREIVARQRATSAGALPPNQAA